MRKICANFYCEKCDYRCSRKFLWEQHLATQKHNRQRQATLTTHTIEKTKHLYNCEHCGKTYKQRSGLWRHQKICGIQHVGRKNEEYKNYVGYTEKKENVILKKNVEENSNKYLENGSNIIKNLENENSELRYLMEKMMNGISDDTKVKNEMMEQLKEQSKIIQEMIPRIGNNNNNRFNINLFLNQQCKNAINLSDFIQSLKVQLGDLIYTKDKGLIEGVSNVFVNALKELDTFSRPIHCTDIKRETLYIRENNEWERDDDKQIIKHAITDVAKKQRTAIQKWEEEHPDWEDSEKGREEYMTLVKCAMKDISDSPTENKIIKNIVKETVISKDILLDK